MSPGVCAGITMCVCPCVCARAQVRVCVCVCVCVLQSHSSLLQQLEFAAVVQFSPSEKMGMCAAIKNAANGHYPDFKRKSLPLGDSYPPPFLSLS